MLKQILTISALAYASLIASEPLTGEITISGPYRMITPSLDQDATQKVIDASTKYSANSTTENKALLEAAIAALSQKSTAAQPAASSNTQNEYTIRLESGLPTAFATNGVKQSELPEALSFLQDYFATPVTQTDAIKDLAVKHGFSFIARTGSSSITSSSCSSSQVSSRSKNNFWIKP